LTVFANSKPVPFFQVGNKLSKTGTVFDSRPVDGRYFTVQGFPSHGFLLYVDTLDDFGGYAFYVNTNFTLRFSQHRRTLLYKHKSFSV
jgi:hypothetical protein